MKHPLIPFLAAAALAAAMPAVAQQHQHADHKAAATTGTTESNDYVQGEVRKVDKEAGKLTLKHGPIPNLDMPGMTMVFKAKDPAMLDQVKVGDAVRFRADKVNGAITVTELRPGA